MKAISKTDLYYINHLSKKASNEQTQFTDVHTLIKTKINKHSFNNKVVVFRIPSYWSPTVLCMVDDIIRMVPDANFISITEHLAGLQVKVDGFGHGLFDIIKKTVQRAQDRVDYLVQKRINEHIEVED